MGASIQWRAWESARGLAQSKTLRVVGGRRNSRQRPGGRGPPAAFPGMSRSLLAPPFASECRKFTWMLGVGCSLFDVSPERSFASLPCPLLASYGRSNQNQRHEHLRQENRGGPAYAGVQRNGPRREWCGREMEVQVRQSNR